MEKDPTERALRQEQSKRERKQSTNCSKTSFAILRCFYIFVLYNLGKAGADPQGPTCSPTGTGYYQPIGGTRTIQGAPSGRCSYSSSIRSEEHQPQEKACWTYRKITESTKQKTGAMGSLSKRDERALPNRAIQVREGDERDQDCPGRDTAQPRQGNEGHHHGGAGGDHHRRGQRVRPVDQKSGQAKGQNQESGDRGKVRRYGSGTEHDPGKSKDVSTAASRDASSDVLCGTGVEDSNTVASAGLWVAAAPAFGSRHVANEEKQLALETWYHSDMDTIHRQEGWTMTLQTRDFYNFCTTLDWETDGNLELCVQQLQQSAICDGELREVRDALLDTPRSPATFDRISYVFTELCTRARPEQATVTTPMSVVQCVEALQQAPPTQWKMPKPMGAKFRYILHLFAGVRRKGDLHSIMQALQVPDGHAFFPASIDVVLCSKRGDLTARSAQDFWIEASQRRAIAAVIGGPPCESGSIARWRFYIELCGPRPIRDGMDPLNTIWAKNPPVRIRDLRQLHCVNQLLLFTLLLAITQAALERVSSWNTRHVHRSDLTAHSGLVSGYFRWSSTCFGAQTSFNWWFNKAYGEPSPLSQLP